MKRNAFSRATTAAVAILATATGLAVPTGPAAAAFHQTEWISGDFDGNGQSDLVHVWSGGINTFTTQAYARYTLRRERWKPRADYAMNVTTTRWLAGDASRDGRSDLVHLWSGGVNTLLSNGNGTSRLVKVGWKPRANYAMNVGTTQWVSGDVSGDGRSDLVHLWSGGINTLIANGDGTYRLAREAWKPRADYAMNVRTTEWSIGDVNGDRKSDLVHLWSGGVNTLLSNGNGTSRLVKEGWKPRANYAMNVGTTQWVSGNVSGDGRSDLVHLWSGGINTLMANGDGTYRLAREAWKPRSDYQMNIATTRWNTGDIYPDGRSDLLHLTPAGIDTLTVDQRDGGTYTIWGLAWKPRADYNMGL